MQKLILFTLFSFISIVGLKGQAGAQTVCPSYDPAEVCGCTSGCNPILCSPNGTGNCTTISPGTITISVPAGQNVTVTVTRPTCAATAGLDTGESYTIGSVTNTSTGSNSTPPFTGCLATGGTASTFDVTVNSQRKDECIDIDVTFTPNGGTPDPTCEILTAALPVELISFDAKIKSEIINLSWKTASEIDNDYFQIEHSSNGIVFFPVGKIIGNGTTFEEQSYQFNHNRPDDRTNFYRLKQVDFDGKFEYSRIVSVDFKKANSWRLFPTQSNEGITIDWSNDFSAETISIFNLNGKMVHFERIDADSQLKYISIKDLPSGSYFLKMQSGRSVSSKRFFKIQ